MTTLNLAEFAKPRTVEILDRARTHSNRILETCRVTTEAFLDESGINSSTMCFVVIGSVGRLEALEASDIDIIPVALNAEALEEYLPFDQQYRAGLSTDLGGMKVSAGADLTKPTSIVDITDAASIGGENDNSSNLTKRILILTESQQAGGALDINDARRSILDAYADCNRTRGRHVLSLCNDIARYYRTLCIEYKAKVDNEDKDWCTRNLKLRHSRKLWYFSCLIAVASVAHLSENKDETFADDLLIAFAQPPLERVISSVGTQCRVATTEILERFGFFLDFMSQSEHREMLATTDYEQRHAADVMNAFPVLKMNSALLHNAMLSVITDCHPDIRRKALDWFLM